MATAKYEALLVKHLREYSDVCNKLTALARQQEMRQEHIDYAQETTGQLTRDLRKNLEFKHPKVASIELPVISSKSKADSVSSKEGDTSDSKTSESKTPDLNVNLNKHNGDKSKESTSHTNQ
jgi:hypothetical protein